jgi:hypothetical protein
MNKTLTGGCQFGRIRYAMIIESDDACLCLCRMRQRSSRDLAAALASMPPVSLEWLSAPDLCQSSPIADRRLCPTKGMPLGFAFLDSPNSDLSLSSFNDASSFVHTEPSAAESLYMARLGTYALPRLSRVETPGAANRRKTAGLEVPE